LRVVADQVGAPTAAALLADVTVKVLFKMADQPATDGRWGLYHLAASGETSWYGLAHYAIARARALGLPLQAAPENIEPIATANYPTAAQRPTNSRLATAKLRENFALMLPDWSVGVDAVVDQLVAEMRS
jgi:dTDP-4-dehydrorhamnose reductase